MDGVPGVMVPATNAGATVTVFPTEHRDAGENAESATLYEYVFVDVGNAV